MNINSQFQQPCCLWRLVVGTSLKLCGSTGIMVVANWVDTCWTSTIQMAHCRPSRSWDQRSPSSFFYTWYRVDCTKRRFWVWVESSVTEPALWAGQVRQQANEIKRQITATCVKSNTTALAPQGMTLNKNGLYSFVSSDCLLYKDSTNIMLNLESDKCWME